MTPRFQADADFSHKIVLALRRRESAIDLGMRLRRKRVLRYSGLAFGVQ